MPLSTLAFGTASLLVLAALWWWDQRKVPAGRAAWSIWPADDRDLTRIAAYARDRVSTAPVHGMDDRTWADLNMDDVFRLLDRTESLVGQQVLYGRLRSVPVGDALDAFDALADRLGSDVALRLRVETALRRMRRVDGHDLVWLVQPGSFASAPWHVVFPLLTLLVIATAALATQSIAFLLLLAPILIVAIGLRTVAAPHVRVAGSAFRQVEPLLRAGETLAALPFASNPLAGGLADVARLGALRRVAGWAGRDPSRAATGELTAVLFEYLNLLLSLDGNAVFFGARLVKRDGAALLRVVQSVGEVDAALSVASYRAATPHWTRPVFSETAPVVVTSVRHPLVPDAVPATVQLAPPYGVIITGANMSGKTTFLRALGVNVVLAQTIRTVAAETYVAPVLTVRSCIGRADDPATGKSYFLVEVETVLNLVAASASATPHLLLFDELFRGTNAVERIAAGEAVLATLLAGLSRGHRHLIVAATHDQELVDLLRADYAPFHFADAIGPDGLRFDYQLRPGPAVTRNAIALLGLRGAPAALVDRATARADALDRARATRS